MCLGLSSLLCPQNPVFGQAVDTSAADGTTNAAQPLASDADASSGYADSLLWDLSP